MSILVRGMEMPKSCRDCLLEQPYDGYNCGINGKSYNWGIEGRPYDCPLVEVPPHGRLIDADAVVKFPYYGDNVEAIVYESMSIAELIR